MPSALKGSIHLFRLAGVDVYLHWMWFLVAFWEIQSRDGRYSNIGWSIAEYLALFLIVLTHEFGHAMACRSVGGSADQILLWPFGGVAYVRPPQRPGATLWSIAAGPLVNVALAPVLYIVLRMAQSMGLAYTNHDAYEFLRMVLILDVGLFVFNILPIYPMDGGQIFRSLLWYAIGRGRSLLVATVVGFVGIAALAAWAVSIQLWWTLAVCVFLAINCWNGFKRARILMKLARLPRWDGFLCPSCRTAPPIGAFWRCDQCQQPFDTFATQALCPNCGHQHTATLCVDCNEISPRSAWAHAHVLPGVESASFEVK